LYLVRIFYLPVNLLAALIATSFASLPVHGNKKPVMSLGVTSLRIYASFAFGSVIVRPPYTCGRVLNYLVMASSTDGGIEYPKLLLIA